MSGPSTQDQPVVGQITLRYWAAARASTGVAEEFIAVNGPVSLATLIDGAIERFGPESRLEQVLSACSVLVGDQPVATRDPRQVEVVPGQSVEFLPPFAGG